MGDFLRDSEDWVADCKYFSNLLSASSLLAVAWPFLLTFSETSSLALLFMPFSPSKSPARLLRENEHFSPGIKLDSLTV